MLEKLKDWATRPRPSRGSVTRWDCKGCEDLMPTRERAGLHIAAGVHNERTLPRRERRARLARARAARQR